MPDLTQRSYKKELLDSDDIPFEDIRQNMQELDFINTHLGGHAITIAGLSALLQFKKEKIVINICEIGCGGGDNLRVLKKWCSRKNISATFTGIDINEHCIAFAKLRDVNEGVHFICSNYKTAVLAQKPDIIFSSLFCHHFTNEGMIDILQWCSANAAIGFFINDLHRNPIAYYTIKWLTRFFSKSYLVKNDAPLSVLRGFSKKEIEIALKNTGITAYAIKWKWAFRWLVYVPNTKN